LAKIISTADLIFDSVNRNLETLLDAWAKELEAADKAFRERAKQLNEKKAQDAAIAKREAFQDLRDAAQASALFHYVSGALNAAEANDSLSISIPAGVQVASTHLSGPSIAALADLISDLSDELAVSGEDDPSQAQQSALWAIAHGYAPHGNDLAEVINQVESGHPWANRFSELATEQTSLPRHQAAPAKLRAFTAHKEINLLQEQVQNIKAFGPENLAQILSTTKSSATKNALQSTLPRRGMMSTTQTKMDNKQFHQMLSKLFADKKS